MFVLCFVLLKLKNKEADRHPKKKCTRIIIVAVLFFWLKSIATESVPEISPGPFLNSWIKLKFVLVNILILVKFSVVSLLFNFIGYCNCCLKFSLFSFIFFGFIFHLNIDLFYFSLMKWFFVLVAEEEGGVVVIIMAFNSSSVVMRLGLSSSPDAASVDSMTLFVLLLCACVLIGHLLEKSRWMTESVVAIIIVSISTHYWMNTMNTLPFLWWKPSAQSSHTFTVAQNLCYRFCPKMGMYDILCIVLLYVFRAFSLES